MIALGCDHGGLALKRHVMEYLDARGLAYHDFGCYTNESCDYPDFGRAAAEAVASGECDRGIVVCTTGIGISIILFEQTEGRISSVHHRVTQSLTEFHE